MSGNEYLESIKAKLLSGHNQHRMGENVLGAFGYLRRRATAINEINKTLNDLGLVAEPPISSEMPLRIPRIRFSLKDQEQDSSIENQECVLPTDELDLVSAAEDEEALQAILTEPSFSVSELKSANTEVDCISASESIKTAYTST